MASKGDKCGGHDPSTIRFRCAICLYEHCYSCTYFVQWKTPSHIAFDNWKPYRMLWDDEQEFKSQVCVCAKHLKSWASPSKTVRYVPALDADGVVDPVPGG